MGWLELLQPSYEQRKIAEDGAGNNMESNVAANTHIFQELNMQFTSPSGGLVGFVYGCPLPSSPSAGRGELWYFHSVPCLAGLICLENPFPREVRGLLSTSQHSGPKWDVMVNTACQLSLESP